MYNKYDFDRVRGPNFKSQKTKTEDILPFKFKKHLAVMKEEFYEEDVEYYKNGFSVAGHNHCGIYDDLYYCFGQNF